jgi:cell division protein FtsQ
MRRRRIGVRRAEGRRRLKRLTLVLAAVAVIVLGLAATRSPLLDVGRVTVRGTEHTDPEAVLRAAGVERGSPLVGVDTAAVARRVEELPWVAEAHVGRSWPSTVTIRVTERAPAATLRVNADQVALVDDSGRILSFEPVADEAAPEDGGPVVLTGVDGRLPEGGRLGADARSALAVAIAVRDRMPGAVASVSTDLDAVLVEGGTIRFGSTARLDDKVTAAQTVLDQVDTGCLEVLDVRVPGSPALTRNQRCS